MNTHKSKNALFNRVKKLLLDDSAGPIKFVHFDEQVRRLNNGEGLVLMMSRASENGYTCSIHRVSIPSEKIVCTLVGWVAVVHLGNIFYRDDAATPLSESVQPRVQITCWETLSDAGNCIGLKRGDYQGYCSMRALRGRAVLVYREWITREG